MSERDVQEIFDEVINLPKAELIHLISGLLKERAAMMRKVEPAVKALELSKRIFTNGFGDCVGCVIAIDEALEKIKGKP